jgi:sugar phosphate isomerase/epimerase
MSDSALGAALTRFDTPFRLGSTSYVYPDDILPNVKKLATSGDVDDIELILFEVDDGPNNLPNEMIIQELVRLAALHGVTYTVHLPLDLRLGAEGSLEHESLSRAKRVIEATAPLTPLAYVFHLDGEGMEKPGWHSRSLNVLETVLKWIPDPAMLAVENLENQRPDLLEPVLEALPISRTVDIGHLWKQGLDPRRYLEAWLPRARVIHMHGLGERDHRSLALMEAEQLDPVVAQLRSFKGVVTLEVFETADFFSSRDALIASFRRVTDE